MACSECHPTRRRPFQLQVSLRVGEVEHDASGRQTVEATTVVRSAMGLGGMGAGPTGPAASLRALGDLSGGVGIRSCTWTITDAGLPEAVDALAPRA